MEYRFLGNSGLQISRIGFGNMINYGAENEETNVAIIKRCIELGINFFDTAEYYGFGEAEETLGRTFKLLNVPRESIVVATKIMDRHDGKGNGINRTLTLSRKHVMEGTNNSLKRLQLDYVDIIFAHFFDYNTTMEEICRGFNQVIEEGKAFYWATSNWSSVQIQEAINTCDKLGLHRPVAEQCQYNMLERNSVENEITAMFDKYNYGTTIWSPLAMGLLTGKYNHEIPEDSRSAQGLKTFSKEMINNFFYNKHFNNPVTMKKLVALEQVAKDFGCTQAQLAVAWTLRNKDVSSALIGARSVAQLEDTVKAVELVKKFTPELDEQIEAILENRPVRLFDVKSFAALPKRR